MARSWRTRAHGWGVASPKKLLRGAFLFLLSAAVASWLLLGGGVQSEGNNERGNLLGKVLHRPSAHHFVPLSTKHTPPQGFLLAHTNKVAPSVVSLKTSFAGNTANEIVVQNNPGTIKHAIFANSSADGGAFITKIKRLSYCHYEVHNFCVDRGTLLFFHHPMQGTRKAKQGLRACNEFSRHSPSIYIKYWSIALSNSTLEPLPAPLNTVTKGWILQFWCQDLFHMTLSLLPAFHTKRDVGQQDADVYIRIARGIRRKGGYCNVKLGDPQNFENPRNIKYNQDHQFPFAGNPYWPFYRILTSRSEKIHPLKSGTSLQAACYQHGVIDKRYIKSMMGSEARNYSVSVLEMMGVPPGQPRPCGSKYRATMIDRRGRTRRLTNIPDIVQIMQSMGFDSQVVAFETLPIREQLRIVTMTDLLIGVHGNGLMWLQFLPPGSAVIELVGVWYTPYTLLWGHSYFHSKDGNNPEYKQRGEYHPFAHNITEVRELLAKAKGALDRTRCGKTPFNPPNEQLSNLYSSCAPHC
ncbi:glycosyltransferase [Trypanosoma rangeli]|uniref:Glycosyltransferase n=1 Tax=Trypanosoma rangeli TaxID=5698 RepID=A0A3R7MV05_TRYRA|nr:glycosyltransferase [Trypanosoma rangeli]RNF11700.1 glycosyltransferase [Trypanosoma rangeli]|eukprot:RNF11700.1 glycosyltransferase [Trypanosoma rangeli]